MVSLHHQLALTQYNSPSLSRHHHRLLLLLRSSFLCITRLNDDYGHTRRHDSVLTKGRRSMLFDKEEDDPSGHNDAGYDCMSRFEDAVKLFNQREYYACHDLLESLWYESNDPLRTLLHAILQCSVAFHHLFNQNHKGAMMEMGEGVCKLRKLNFVQGPFHEFEQQISGVLNFIYQTQLELAACNEDLCITMEQNEISYRLLEGFGAGQRLYFVERIEEGTENNTAYIAFDPQASYGATGLPTSRVQLPILRATRQHLVVYENY